MKLESELDQLNVLFEYFDNKAFMRHQPQGLGQAVIKIACAKEEQSLCETVTRIVDLMSHHIQT